ncbi:MAG TPA: LysE family translocator [Candidatus Acidoferrum sp.]|nr:LysE family translocator [Candidatus Acidoferrum sp.]
MSTGHAILTFTIAAALLTITPGLDTALVLRTAAVEGRRRAVFAGVGICCGLFTWALAVSVGLATLISVSRLGYNVLRFAGAFYLIYLGAKIFFRRHVTVTNESSLQLRRSNGSSIRTPNWLGRGFLTNILNPKVGVFYMTFLPQFIPAGAHVASFSLLLASIHVTEGVVWFSILIMASGALSSWLRRPQVAQSIDRFTGTVLIGFGIALVFEQSR